MPSCSFWSRQSWVKMKIWQCRPRRTSSCCPLIYTPHPIQASSNLLQTIGNHLTKRSVSVADHCVHFHQWTCFSLFVNSFFLYIPPCPCILIEVNESSNQSVVSQILVEPWPDHQTSIISSRDFILCLIKEIKKEREKERERERETQRERNYSHRHHLVQRQCRCALSIHLWYAVQALYLSIYLLITLPIEWREENESPDRRLE